MLRPFGVHGPAVHHARLADREIGNVDHLLYFAIAFGLDFARLQGDQAAQRVFVFSQPVGNIAHRFAANGRRDVLPGRERLLRSADHLLVFGLRS